MSEKYEILVELKKEVLDTEGRAIQEALLRLGHQHIKNIKISKRFEVEIEEGAPPQQQEIEKIAKEVLANPVSQTVKITAKGSNEKGR